MAAPHTAMHASADAALRAWHSLRAAGDLQFAPWQPVPPSPPWQPPAWLLGLGHGVMRIVHAIAAPLARALGIAGPVIESLLIGAAACVLAWLIWRLGTGLWHRRRARPAPVPAPAWVPGPGAAAALLDDADRLAQHGRYAEAAHLLLRRSCAQISAAHPEWLHPASTARDIAALPALPAPARTAFATIADRVEISRYGLRALIEADWQAARAAYARFALAGLAAA